MRIALVSRQLVSDPHSGIARATRDLAGALCERGHAVHVVTEGNGQEPARGAVLHDVAGGRPLERAAAVHAALARIHAESGLDVAAVPLWGSEGLFAVHDPRFATVVSCMTTACTIAAIDPGWGATPSALEAVRLERSCLRSARHLHGLTRAALDTVFGEYGKPATLTCAVVPRGLSDRRDDERDRNGRGDPVELLFIGRLELRKGVDVLLEAFAELVAGGVDARLTLAGPDTLAGLRADFEARAPAQLAARVRFAGAVDDAQLHELLAGADVVCQPSRFESHGIVLIEAMMFGRAIVTTAAGGIPEVVEPGGNALLAPPGDAAALARVLREAIVSADLRRQLGNRSRELYLERYEAGRVAAAMESLLADAAAAHARHPHDSSPAAALATALDEQAAAAAADGAEWRLRAELAEARLAGIESSRSWRLTAPLRGAVARVRYRRVRG